VLWLSTYNAIGHRSAGRPGPQQMVPNPSQHNPPQPAASRDVPRSASGTGPPLPKLPCSATMKVSWRFLVCLLVATWAYADNDLVLWYQKPARETMTEALPVGNGRLGGLVHGDPQEERIIVNEDSLWTGDENPSGNYDTMGAYQVLGEVRVHLPAHAQTSGYRRDLDISQALSRVTYQASKVNYQREFFSSHPAEVLVARFTADRPGGYTGSVEMRDGHAAVAAVQGNRMVVTGVLSNGLKYDWEMIVLPEGGVIAPENSSLTFSNLQRPDPVYCGRHRVRNGLHDALSRQRYA